MRKGNNSCFCCNFFFLHIPEMLVQLSLYLIRSYYLFFQEKKIFNLVMLSLYAIISQQIFAYSFL